VQNSPRQLEGGMGPQDRKRSRASAPILRIERPSKSRIYRRNGATKTPRQNGVKPATRLREGFPFQVRAWIMPVRRTQSATIRPRGRAEDQL